MNTDQQHRAMAFPLRLALSLKNTANLLALKDGVSLNYFITVAVVEKISRVQQTQSLTVQGPMATTPGNRLPQADGVRKLSNYS